jgi:hypothetical protein
VSLQQLIVRVTQKAAEDRAAASTVDEGALR